MIHSQNIQPQFHNTSSCHCQLRTEMSVWKDLEELDSAGQYVLYSAEKSILLKKVSIQLKLKKDFSIKMRLNQRVCSVY